MDGQLDIFQLFFPQWDFQMDVGGYILNQKDFQCIFSSSPILFKWILKKMFSNIYSCTLNMSVTLYEVTWFT